VVACTWAARFGDDGQPHVERVLPDGCIDVLWMDGRLVVAGPDTRAMPLARRPAALFVGIRLRPGVAPSLLGAPASALLDARIDASDVLGDRAKALSDGLAGAPSAREAAGHLTVHVAKWLRWSHSPDEVVQGAIATLRRTGPPKTIAGVAADLGVSERQLHRRFVVAVGYGPKLLARILRLQRFVTHASRPDAPPLAQLAWAAGYADQPHLSRECQDLAGVSPATLVGYPSLST